MSITSEVWAAADIGDQSGRTALITGWRAEFKGRPVRRESNAHSHDADAQRRLWALSEELTGVTYPI